MRTYLYLCCNLFIITTTSFVVYTDGMKPNCTDFSSSATSTYPQFKLKPSSLNAHVGKTVTITCEGLFSSENSGAQWFVNSSSPWGIMCMLASSPQERKICNRYRVTPYPDSRGANLTVNVTEEDFNLPLQCELQTAQVGAFQPCVTVFIHPYPPDKKQDIGLILAIVVPFAVVLLAVVICLIYFRYEPQITFSFYSWYMLRCQKTQRGRFGCDVLVIHDDDDHTFVREHITPKLENLAYLTHKTMATDLSGGQPLFEGTKELMEDSHSVMFVITPAIVNEALFSHLLNVAIKLKRQILLVTVHPEGLKLASWETLTKSYSKSKTLATGLKHMRCVKWPGNKASGRLVKNFWCKIRRQLPIVNPSHQTVSPKYTLFLKTETVTV